LFGLSVYLQATAPYASNLGISDGTLVETPSLLSEIDRLRMLQCN